MAWPGIERTSRLTTRFGGSPKRNVVTRSALDRLAALRGPGESYSDVIVRLSSSGEPR
jgi:hypothetical protein